MTEIVPSVQGIILKLSPNELLEWIEAFLVDRQAQNAASGTVTFYRKKLKIFLDYCQERSITEFNQLDPILIRRFLFYLKETGHNAGGSHAIYRALRAFLNWYEDEAEPDDWRNPMAKTRAPKVPIEPIEPVAIQDVMRMTRTCNTQSFHGVRDQAMLLALLDTGLRAAEFLQIDLPDLDLTRRSILVRQGKGRKPRTVFLGSRSAKVMRQYLKYRHSQSAALWISSTGERLSYDGLRAVLARRAEAAGLANAPTPHDFRRAFALSMLRSGTDIYTLSKLMGHSNILVLQRYLKQSTQDTELAHRMGSPVDHLIE